MAQFVPMHFLLVSYKSFPTDGPCQASVAFRPEEEERRRSAWASRKLCLGVLLLLSMPMHAQQEAVLATAGSKGKGARHTRIYALCFVAAHGCLSITLLSAHAKVKRRARQSFFLTSAHARPPSL